MASQSQHFHEFDDRVGEEGDADDEGERHVQPLHEASSAPVLVQDVREAVDSLRRGMSEKTHEMKEAINKGTDKLYHVVTNNWIVQFRVGVDGKLNLERTVKSINLHTKKLNEAKEKLITVGKQVPINAQKQWRKTITGNPNKRIRDHMKETPQVKLLDKISFTAGVGVITFTEFLVMRHPDWFPNFFTWFMLLLFVIRYVMYKKSKYHLFMLDFCYVVNISCMLQAYFQPNCLPWFKANFALCMGPLCMAILTWHNSLVFHSLEKLTSFFLHAFPPMLCHLYRWQLIPTEAITAKMEWTYGELFWPALGMYIAWQVSYLFLTEVVYASALADDPSLITSIRWLTRDRHHPMTKIVTQGCRSIGLIKQEDFLDPESLYAKIIFVLVQFTYLLLTMLPSFGVFDYYELSCGWLMFNFAIGTWNGATYYIEIFSKRYNLKFDKPVETTTAASAASVPPSPSPTPLSRSSTQDESSEETSASKSVGAAGDGGDEGLVSSPSPQSGASTAEDSDELNLDESQTLQLVQILQKLEGSKQEEGEKGETLIDETS